MIYNTLAPYYDGLVKDDDATHSWVKFIQEHMQGNSILELACGSGEITIALAQLGYDVEASDISSPMIEAAKQKKGAQKVTFSVMDMCDVKSTKKFDTVLCLCDSINYLLQEDKWVSMIRGVYETLQSDGMFIFDMHSVDRLEEFKEEFYEEGVVEGHEYSWSIISEGDCLYHNFIFYDEQANAVREQHVQRVYDSKYVETLLSPYFTVSVYTDFTLPGIQNGEKYFYVCRKKG